MSHGPDQRPGNNTGGLGNLVVPGIFVVATMAGLNNLPPAPGAEHAQGNGAAGSTPLDGLKLPDATGFRPDAPPEGEAAFVFPAGGVNRPVPPQRELTSNAPSAAAGASDAGSWIGRVASHEVELDRRGVWNSLASAWAIAKEVIAYGTGIAVMFFTYLTWRKRGHEVLVTSSERNSINEKRLHSSLSLQMHEIVEEEGACQLRIRTSERDLLQLFLGEHEIYSDIIKKAAALASPKHPFPMFKLQEAIESGDVRLRARVKGLPLPDAKTVERCFREAAVSAISEKFYRKSHFAAEKGNSQHALGILLRKESPEASTLALCIITASDLLKFQDAAWVTELKKNSHPKDGTRIDQLVQASEIEYHYLTGSSSTSVFPSADVDIVKKKPKKKNAAAASEESAMGPELTVVADESSASADRKPSDGDAQGNHEQQNENVA